MKKLVMRRPMAALVGILSASLLLGGGVPAVAADTNTASISGSVTAPAGTDLTTVKVEVFSVESVPQGRGSATVTADGTYQIAGLSAASYRVLFTDGNGPLADQYYLNKPVFETSTLVPLSDGYAATGINAALTEGGKITGSVSVPAGIDPTTVRVNAVHESSVVSASGFAAVAPDGSYSMTGLPVGAYWVYFYDSTYPSVLASQLYDNAVGTDQAKLVNVTAGGSAPDINAAMTLGGSINGVISGIPAGWYSCVEVWPVGASVAAKSATVSGKTSLSLNSTTPEIKPLAAATNWCEGGIPVGPQGQLAIDGLPAGGYKLFLGVPFTFAADGEKIFANSAPQWLQSKVLKPTAAIIEVTAGGSTTIDAAAFPVRTFTDVPPQNLFFEEISWLGSTGISTGYEDGTFGPLRAVNRDAMAAFLYRLAGSPEFTPPAVSPFKDVSTTNMYYKQIAWLAHEGISTGWTEPDKTKTFRPLEPVARDAMAAFLYRFAGNPTHTPPTVSPFRDISTTNVYYKQISWLASTEISTGWTEADKTKTYRPLSSVNRDAMAAFMNRYADLINAQP